MKTEKLKNIKLHGSDVEKLLVHEDGFDEDGKPENDSKDVKGFENWYVNADRDTGDFESSKSSMVDFQIDLYDDKGEYRGTAIGGYYNEMCGYQFDFSSDHYYTFNPPEPETPESKFDDFLRDISDDDSLSVKQKAKKLRKYLEKLENA